MTQQMIFLEFFAGGGMARLGLEGLFQCVFANDNNAKKAASYITNFESNHLKHCDITELQPGDLPTADLAWASFPCQDLSSAGTRGGLKAARSGTFWTFWQLIEALEKQGRGPGTIVLENVTGLLNSNGGADFSLLVETIARAGYKLGAVVIDAADFVPQSRPRLFLIATTRDVPAGLSANLPGNFHPPKLVNAVAALPAHAQKAWYWWQLSAPPLRNTSLIDMLDETTPETAWYSQAKLDHLLAQMAPLHRARVDAAIAAKAPRVGGVYRRIRNGIQRAEVRYDGLAGCLRTLKGGSSRQLLLCSKNGKLRLRAMSASEAARLMGLPSTYILPEGATHAINLCGDGVCVPVVRHLATELLVPLAQSHQTREQTRLKSSQAI